MSYRNTPEEQGKERAVEAAAREAGLKRIFAQSAAERTEMLKAVAARFAQAEQERKIKEVNDQITQHEQSLKAALKASYTAAQGGNEAGFEAAYPKLRQQWIEALRKAEVKPETGADVVKRTLELRYGVKK